MHRSPCPASPKETSVPLLFPLFRPAKLCRRGLCVACIHTYEGSAFGFIRCHCCLKILHNIWTSSSYFHYALDLINYVAGFAHWDSTHRRIHTAVLPADRGSRFPGAWKQQPWSPTVRLWICGCPLSSFPSMSLKQPAQNSLGSLEQP